MPWACTVCTVINDVDEWLCCDVCGSARESPTERDAPTNVEGLHREGAEDAPPTTAEGAPSNAIVIDDDDDDAGGGAALPGPGEKRPRAPLAAGGENPSKRPKADATSALMAAARRPPADGRQPVWGPKETPVCEVGDTARCAALLKRFGCVVFRGAATAEACGRLEALFWDWLEREHPSVDRSDATTHSARVFGALGHANSGVVTTGSIGQSALLWAARQEPGVVDAWRTVWGLPLDEPAATTRQLITSFDGCGVWRNPCAHRGPGVRTAQSWYHLDQNAAKSPAFVGYQGCLTVWGASGHTGSTVVCPASHRDFAANCARGGKAPRGAFVRMAAPGDADYCARTARQVAPLGAGDLVIWDSRVVHCSNGAAKGLRPEHVLEARGLPPDARQPSLLRLACYVAMMPRARASPAVADARRRAVAKGTTAGHDPLRMRGGATSAKHAAPAPGDPLFRLV